MLNKKIESKFQRFAEVLPTNARTAVILKEREEIRAAKEAQEKQVSPQASELLSLLLRVLISTAYMLKLVALT